MDPNAALAAGNFEDLATWIRRGGFHPDWTKYPEQTKRYRNYLARLQPRELTADEVKERCKSKYRKGLRHGR